MKERSMVKRLLFISCLLEAVHVSVNPSLLGYNSSYIIIIICWDMHNIYMYGCILCINNCNSTCEYKCLSGEFNVAKAEK